MILLRLFLEFCKVGLFSIGGGLATIPFLTDLGERTGWFTSGQLADMIAVSESTPGPMGVNTATYVGFTTAGIPGGIAATLGLVFPSIVVILIIAQFLQRFRQSKAVDAVAEIALLRTGMPFGAAFFNWKAIVLAAVVFILMKYTPAKKLHPICFIGLSALAGILFQM